LISILENVSKTSLPVPAKLKKTIKVAKGIAEYLGLSASGGSSGSSEGGYRYTVTQATPSYLTIADTLAGSNQRTTVSPGTYHVFNTSQGMINVTSKQGVAGSWINPNGSTVSVSYYPATQAGGTSLTDALKTINVDSSFTHRERIARANEIDKYQGSAAQYTQMFITSR